MSTVWWASNTTGIRPAIGSMSSVSQLTDVAPLDTTTYPTPNSGAIPAGVGGGSVYGFIVWDIGSLLTLSGLSLTWNVDCGNDPGHIGGDSDQLLVEYSPDSTDGLNNSWVTIGTDTHGGVTYEGILVPRTYAPSVSGLVAKMVRAKISVGLFAALATTAAIRASDMRVTTVPITPTSIKGRAFTHFSGAGHYTPEIADDTFFCDLTNRTMMPVMTGICPTDGSQSVETAGSVSPSQETTSVPAISPETATDATISRESL